MDTKIGLEWLTVLAVIPATAMILEGHPWLAAGIVGAVLVTAVVVVHLGERALTQRDKEILAYASTAATFGIDPTPVVRALRPDGGEKEDRVVVQEARGPQLHRPRGRW